MSDVECRCVSALRAPEHVSFIMCRHSEGNASEIFGVGYMKTGDRSLERFTLGVVVAVSDLTLNIEKALVWHEREATPLTSSAIDSY